MTDDPAVDDRMINSMKSEITKSDILKSKIVFIVRVSPEEWYEFQVAKKRSKNPRTKKMNTIRFFACLQGTGTRQKHTYMGVLSTTGAIRTTENSKMHDQSKPLQIARQAMTYIWRQLELPDGFSIEQSVLQS